VQRHCTMDKKNLQRSKHRNFKSTFHVNLLQDKECQTCSSDTHTKWKLNLLCYDLFASWVWPVQEITATWNVHEALDNKTLTTLYFALYMIYWPSDLIFVQFQYALFNRLRLEWWNDWRDVYGQNTAPALKVICGTHVYFTFGGYCTTRLQ
jgi:hypothetical protein